MEDGKALVIIMLFIIGIGFIDLNKTKTNLEAMKKQAESTSVEYDRLAEEHQKLVVSLGVCYINVCPNICILYRRV